MRSLIELMVRKPYLSTILIFTVLSVGWSAYNSIQKSVFPETEPSIVTVRVGYRGAPPREVELSVVNKVETALKGMPGIDRITSVSQDSVALLTIELSRYADPTKTLNEIKNTIDAIPSFPDGALRPSVFLQTRKGRGINLALEVDYDDLSRLRDEAQSIYDALTSLPDISQVDISGVPTLQYEIQINDERIRALGLTLSQIRAAIQQENFDLSAGRVYTTDSSVLVRTRGRQIEPFALHSTVLRSTPGGGVVTLEDIASIQLVPLEEAERSLQQGKNAAKISITTLPSEDVFTVVKHTHNFIEKYNTTHLDSRLEVIEDRSIYLRQRLDLLISSGITGLLLVAVLLTLFLNTKVAFWVAMSIPFSFLGMFIVGSMASITINVISLFGMILVIGILVDDGIVIGENIYQKIEAGHTGKKAAIEGTLEVLPAVTASVLTTMLAFVPFFLLDGRIGNFMVEMAIVVIACLGFSLVDAFFVLPAHLSHLQQGREASAQSRLHKLQQTTNRWIQFAKHRVYKPVATKSVNNPYTSVALGFFLILGSFGLVNGGFVEKTFFPHIDSDNLKIELAFAPGTPSSRTMEAALHIDRALQNVQTSTFAQSDESKSAIESWLVTLHTGAGESGTHALRTEIKLLSADERGIPSFEISNAIQNAIGPIEGAEKFTVGGGRIFGKPVVVQLKSNDLQSLDLAQAVVLEQLSQFPELKNIAIQGPLNPLEKTIEPNQLARSLGISRSQVASAVQTGLLGAEIDRTVVQGQERLVVLRGTPDLRYDPLAFDRIDVEVGQQRIPASLLIDSVLGKRTTQIQHEDGNRQTVIEADVLDPDAPVPPILEKVNVEILQPLEQEFQNVTTDMIGQARESKKFFGSAAKIFPLILLGALFLITTVFGSFSQSILVLLMIPFGFVGAIWGHGIEGKPLSLLSLYGLIALSGVVINDAVVLVDKYNAMKSEGMPARKAALEAGLSRFRAIVLTSLTTIVGLYPLILNQSRQGQFLIPMAISIAYGVLIATACILVFLPALLLVSEHVQAGLGSLKRKAISTGSFALVIVVLALPNHLRAEEAPLSFRKLDLNTIVETALLQNLEVQIQSIASERGASRNSWLARFGNAGGLPTVGATLSVPLGAGSSAGGNDASNVAASINSPLFGSVQAGLSARWKFFDSGSVILNLRNLQHTERHSQATLQLALEQTIQNAIQQYFAVLNSQLARSAATAQNKELKQLHEAAKLNYSYGFFDSLGLRVNAQSYAAATQTLFRSQQDFLSQNRQLNTLLNLPESAVFQINELNFGTEATLVVQALQDASTGLQIIPKDAFQGEFALTNNLNLKVRRLEEELARNQRHQSRSTFGPDASLSLQVNRPLSSGASFNTFAGLQLSWNLFNGGAAFAAARQAEDALVQSQIRTQEFTDRIRRDETFLQQQQSVAQQSVELALMQLQTAADAAKNAQQQYALGQVDAIGVASTVAQFWATAQTYIQSQATLHNIQIERLKLRGQLVSKFETAE
jgi:multidrug efflux pump subunit AcrB/outer membrane protein TolC